VICFLAQLPELPVSRPVRLGQRAAAGDCGV